MPKTNPKKPRPAHRRDGLPPLKGVKFEDALKAAMATKLPKSWKPPKAPKAAPECQSERVKGEEEQG